MYIIREYEPLLTPSHLLRSAQLPSNLGGFEFAMNLIKSLGDVDVVFMCPGVGSGLRRCLHALLSDAYGVSQGGGAGDYDFSSPDIGNGSGNYRLCSDRHVKTDRN